MQSPHTVEEEVADYLTGIRLANSEEAKKLRFQNLLSRLFKDTAEARTVVDQLAQGGEQTIFNIPRPGVVKTGYADIAYANVIIEWERDLSRTGRHAEDQLAEYLSGKWHSGQRYDHVLIATDGRFWRTYAPDLEVLLGQPSPNRLGLRQIEQFEVKRDNEQAFFYFLDRLLFRSVRRRATLQAVQQDFGDTSRAFINTVQAMQQAMPAPSEQSTVQVAFEQWQRFLQLAYGRFDDRRGVYLVHSYLSVFAKLMAYCVLKPDARPSDDELHGILSGEAFKALNIANFVEGDFFYWVCDSTIFRALTPALRELHNQIREFDFTDVEEDILKGVYQELIDIDTRHALGEYYTPDWLCERVVADLHLERDSQVLDPACGSGSFLRALIARFRAEWPDLSPQRLADQVQGIDVHPLSVQISKTTVLLALGESVARADRPVSLRVYLANTLFLSSDEANKTLFTTGHHFMVTIDGRRLPLNMGPFIGQPDSFAKSIELAQHFIDEQLDRSVSFEAFQSALSRRLPQIELAREQVGELHQVYRTMREAKLAGRDSIWQFVLQNNYQPVFMYRMFDAIVANPPWLTYSDISSGEYQQTVRDIARHYGLMTSAKANNPHLDLAAIFLAHCGKYLAKDGAQLSFVLPRALLTADQHHNLRSGAASGFKLTEIWDLEGVKPLFNVPACVLMATASQPQGADAQRQRALPRNGILGQSFAGRLPRPHMHWSEAASHLTELPTRWYFQELGDGAPRTRKRSALVQLKMTGASGGNAYAACFRQGATIVPRAFYFVALHGPSAPPQADLQGRLLGIRTHRLAEEGAKKPWDNISLRGQMPGKFLFRTAIARNVLPFVLVNPPLVALPIVLDTAQEPNTSGLAGKLRWQLLSSQELTAQGEVEAARWFGQAEKLWNARRSDSAKKQEMGLHERLDFQRGLTAQPVDATWAVMYTASATDASACVLRVDGFAQRFFAESTCYICFVQSEDEARYVEAYLNSGFANGLIKGFQARGLFGPRHVHKKILEFPWPEYSANQPAHRRLTALACEAAAGAQRVIGPQPDLELDPRTLGRLRVRIRAELASLLREIDKLVEAISTGRDLAANALDWKQLTTVPQAVGATEAEARELSDLLRAERESWSERDGSIGGRS